VTIKIIAFIAVALASAVLFATLMTGCAVSPLQTAQTRAGLEFADGRRFYYESGKEHTGIDAEIQEIDPETDKVTKVWRLKVGKSGTPEAAFAAMVQQQNALTAQQKAITELIQRFLDAAIRGAPIPGG